MISVVAWAYVLIVTNVTTAVLMFAYAVTRPTCPAPHAHIAPRRPDQEPQRLTIVEQNGERHQETYDA